MMHGWPGRSGEVDTGPGGPFLRTFCGLLNFLRTFCGPSAPPERPRDGRSSASARDAVVSADGAPQGHRTRAWDRGDVPHSGCGFRLVLEGAPPWTPAQSVVRARRGAGPARCRCATPAGAAWRRRSTGSAGARAGLARPGASSPGVGSLPARCGLMRSTRRSAPKNAPSGERAPSRARCKTSARSPERPVAAARCRPRRSGQCEGMRAVAQTEPRRRIEAQGLDELALPQQQQRLRVAGADLLEPAGVGVEPDDDR